MSSSTIAFRVKPEIKQRADHLFERLGMTTSTAMNILLMQTLEHRGFPFKIVLPEEHEAPTSESEGEEYPNAETRAVLDRIKDGTEPMFGPFRNGEECVAAALAMEG